MKRLICFIFTIIIAAAFFTSCGKSDSSSSAVPDNSEHKIEANIESNSDKTEIENKEDSSEDITPVESSKPSADSASKPTSTPTPEIKPEGNTKPGTKPNESPKSTPTPETTKCGAVGHTSDGKCPVCSSIYTAPVVTPTPTPKPTSAPTVTCPTCGSTAHTQHPIINDDVEVPLPPSMGGYGDGDNPEWENDPPCPVCGSYEHTTHPAPPPVETCGKCGGTGHNASAHCGWCNGINCTSTHCPTCGSTAHTQHPALDGNADIVVNPNPGDGDGDNPEWE